MFAIPTLPPSVLKAAGDPAPFLVEDGREAVQHLAQVLLVAHSAGFVTADQIATIPPIHPASRMAEIIEAAETRLTDCIHERIRKRCPKLDDDTIPGAYGLFSTPEPQWTVSRNQIVPLVGFFVEEVQEFDIASLAWQDPATRSAGYAALRLVDALLLHATLPHEYCSGQGMYHYEEVIEYLRSMMGEHGEDRDGLLRAIYRDPDSPVMDYFDSAEDALLHLESFLGELPYWMDVPLKPHSPESLLEHIDSLGRQIAQWQKEAAPWIPWRQFVQAVWHYLSARFPSTDAIESWFGKIGQFGADDTLNTAPVCRGVWLDDGSHPSHIGMEDAFSYIMETAEIYGKLLVFDDPVRSDLPSKAVESVLSMADGYGFYLLASAAHEATTVNRIDLASGLPIESRRLG